MSELTSTPRPNPPTSAIRTVTYYDGKRQSGLTTLLLRKTLEYSQRNQRVMFVVPNEKLKDDIERRLEGFLGPIPKTYDIICHDPTDEDISRISAVFVDNYIDGPIDNMSWFIDKNPTVDFHLAGDIHQEG